MLNLWSSLIESRPPSEPFLQTSYFFRLFTSSFRWPCIARAAWGSGIADILQGFLASERAVVELLNWSFYPSHISIQFGVTEPKSVMRRSLAACLKVKSTAKLKSNPLIEHTKGALKHANLISFIPLYFFTFKFKFLCWFLTRKYDVKQRKESKTTEQGADITEVFKKRQLCSLLHNEEWRTQIYCESLPMTTGTTLRANDISSAVAWPFSGPKLKAVAIPVPVI